MAKRRKRTNKNVPAKGRLQYFADRLWGKAVLADWNWTCAVCHKKATDPHHLIPRQHQATRYNLRNGIGLCTWDHAWNPDTAPHQNAAGWLLWFSQVYPELHQWYTETVENGDHKRFKGTVNAAYYCNVIRGLKQYVEEEDFERIVGIRFSRWLEESEVDTDSEKE